MALESSTSGFSNVAVRAQALRANTTGSQNVAIRASALLRGTESRNIEIGVAAGELLTTGDDNIDIGNRVSAVARESGTIRIGPQSYPNGDVHRRHQWNRSDRNSSSC